jgi:hypothetical protein
MSVYWVPCGQHAASTIQIHAQGSTMNDHQLTQVGAATLESRISTSLSPTFPSDDTPLAPSCPTQSQIIPSLQIFQENLSKTTSVKRGSTCEWDLPLDFYRCLALSIAHLTTTCSYKVARIIHKDKFNAAMVPYNSYM